MKKIKNKYFVFLWLIIFTPLNFLCGQEKYEREYRIAENQVPENAIQFVEQFNFAKKVKWYKEEGKDQMTIEAKTKHQSRKYSIEFDLDGNIEDVEIKIPCKEIPKQTIQSIEDYLGQTYQKYKIEKVQVQYTGTEEALKRVEANSKSADDLKLQYEIILKGKSEEGYHQYEYLFSEFGEFIQKANIISRNTDNLEY